MYTIIYFIQYGKDCQSVFSPNQAHMLNPFIESLNQDSIIHSRIDTDENGNPIPTREEVSNV